MTAPIPGAISPMHMRVCELKGILSASQIAVECGLRSRNVVIGIWSRHFKDSGVPVRPLFRGGSPWHRIKGPHEPCKCELPIIRALHRARFDSGLTQGEVGALAGISGQTVSNYERGVHSPSATTLIAWANGLAHDLALIPRASSRPAVTRAAVAPSPIAALFHPPFDP